MAGVNDLVALRAEINRRRSTMEQAKGQLSLLQKRLLQEFGCKTIAEAKRKLSALKVECSRLQEQFDLQMEKFEKLWARFPKD